MKQIKELLSQPMSRSEFLRYVGMLLIALFGFSNFIALLLRQNSAHSGAATQERGRGFGSSKFGV
jgi:hypothetical protein